MNSIDFLRQQLSLYEEEEARIDKELDEFIRQPIENDISELKALKQYEMKLVKMEDLIWESSSEAQVLSEKVKQLDLEQQKLKTLILQIDQAQEIKDALILVQSSLFENYSSACKAVSLFLKFDKKQLESIFNDNLVQINEQTVTLKQASELIKQAQTRLVDIISNIMDQKLNTFNENQLEWPQDLIDTWKLFADIEQEELGLEKMTTHAIVKIRKLCQIPLNIGEKNGKPFTAVLTQLFETLAWFLDYHQTHIDYYGKGNMIYMLRAFEKEADFQAIKILDTFAEKREINRLLKEINASSLQPQQQQIPLKNLALILEELAIMSQRIIFFQKFLDKRAKADWEFTKKKEQSILYSPLTGLLKQSELSMRLREILSLQYSTFESHFVQQSIKKALKMDQFEEEELISSCVEDVFFILKKVTSRASATCDVDTVCVILNFCTHFFEDEFLRDGLFRRLLTGYGGEKATLLGERSDYRIGYFVLLNNLETSSVYLSRLINEIEESFNKMLQQLEDVSSQTSEKISSCLSPFSASKQEILKMLQKGLDNVFIQLQLKSKLKQILNELFSGLKYNLTEEEFQESEIFGSSVWTLQKSLANEISSQFQHQKSFLKEGMVKRFSQQFEKLLQDAQVGSYLKPDNFYRLLSLCVDWLAKEFERFLFTHSQMKFNALGAIRFDKDLRLLNQYLGSLLKNNASGSSFRDLLLKLFQISFLLNFETVEEAVEFYKQEKEIQWRLNSKEMKKILQMRFLPHEIERHLK